MKKFILATTIAVSSMFNLAAPESIKADSYSYRCSYQTFCTSTGCYSRQQCCEQVCNVWGYCFWRCWWN